MDRVIRDVGMANATIDRIYRDTVKKCLQVLKLVHELKLEHKM